MSRLNVASINGQALGGRRNFLINPDFGVDQRNNGSVTATGEYPADRWNASLSGPTISFTRQTIADADRQDFKAVSQ